MKKLFLLFIVIWLLNCSNHDNNETEQLPQFTFYAFAEFSITNSQNEDLLDPTSPNHISTENISLLYVINGLKQETYHPFISNPKKFYIYKHQNEYRIRVFMNITETSEKPITYIQWNEMDTDTIETIYKRTNGSIIQQTIWLNGKKIWELGNNTVDPYFVLIK